MANIVLIITSSIFGVLIFLCAFYFLVYFQHPEDKWTSWYPKVVVVAGIGIACVNILLLPLDVANQNGSFNATGGLPMTILNQIFYFATIIFSIIVVPFTVFYYEGDDSKSGDDREGKGVIGQVINAFKWTTPLLIAIICIIAPCWIYLGYGEVPVIEISGVFSDTSTMTDGNFCVNNQCSVTQNKQNFPISIIVYTIILFSFMAWIIFVIFGSTGLFSLPLDLLLEFKNRPKPIKKDVYIEKKKLVGEVAQALMAESKDLKNEALKLGKDKNARFNSKARSYRSKEERFKRDVLLLDQTYRRLEEAYKMHGANPIVIITKLIIGCIGFIISLLWIIHVCLYLIPPLINNTDPTPFLNDMLTALNNVPLFGPLVYGMFAYWLLAAVVKGNLKLGMRVLFVKVYPMKYGETMMSSLVFNTGLICTCSLPVAQFCAMSFADFAKFTSVSSIFTEQALYLKGLKVGYTVFIIAFVCLTFISFFYLKFRPKKKTATTGIKTIII